MAPGQRDERADGLKEGILQRGELAAVPTSDAMWLTFLVADIRGYTTFTQQRGDEAASKLTAKFAMIVRELVAEFDGTVFELRGDEALCVFGSPRQCLRLAVALQERFVEETVADPELPIPVGIGIDAGEAVHSQDGYRGGALNLAARLCGRAKAGQVLASAEVTHLARTIDGLRYVQLERVSLKGLSEPIRPVRVVPEGEDPAQQMPALLAAATPPPTGVGWLPQRLANRPRTVLAGAAVVAVVAAALLVAVRRNDHGSVGLPAFAENSLGIVDPHTGRLVGQVSVNGGPTAVAAGFRSVWTANVSDNSVARVDPATRQVIDRIPVQAAPSAIAVGAGAIWVVNSGADTVSRIDPASDEPQTIDVGLAPSGVVVAFKYVWVTNSGDGTVSRISPAGNREVLPRIEVGSGPSAIAADDELWVTNEDSDTVSEIDPQTFRVLHDIPVGHGPRGVAVVGDNVWVADSIDGTVTQIPKSGTTAAGVVSVGQEPGQVIADGPDVWTALQASDQLVEVDPETGKVARRVSLGPVPGGVVVVDDQFWVTTTVNRSLHRGGTLHLAGAPGSMDPDYPDGPDFGAIFAASYDGLVAFRRAPGADGFTFVPDLATSLPQPTDHGRTYTFTLRRGIRFSTRKTVTADDVRSGIERATAALLAAGFTQLAKLIVGGHRCTPTECELSGVTADVGSNTVTINLVRPTGDLFDLLQLCPAVPSGTPFAEQKTHPIPATGPYRIAHFVPHKTLVLTRNRFFHEWSAAAQPAGFPRRLEWQTLPGGSKGAIDAVAAEHADWADALEGETDLTAYSSDALRAQFGVRLRTTVTQSMYGLFLNTTVPPFDDIRVRKALSYAVDHNAVARGWSVPGVTTCQFLPPDYPGYRPFCPYSSEPRANSYQGPDLSKAFRLMNGLHPERTPVTVRTNPGNRHGMRQIVKALRLLHFPAYLKVWPNTKFAYFPYVTNPQNHVQAAMMGWLNQDFNAANLLSVYRCNAFVPTSTATNNPAGFCDPSIDRLMDRADRVQSTSNALANKLWAEVDARLTKAALWIPIVNPYTYDVVSKRVHNYQRTPTIGVLFDQMWVK